MKRFFGLLVVLALFCGCDDGDMQVESFDFTNATTSKCGAGDTDFFIFKTSGNEVLIFQIRESIFENKVTPPGAPITLPIDGTAVKVIYRLYSGNITSDKICSTIPPSSPNVVEEWIATGGTVEIITNPVRNINETTGANFVTGFGHTITFRNIRFNVGDGRTQTNEVVTFGSYVTDAIDPVDFTAAEIRNCDNKTILFKYSATQAVTLNFDTATFATLFANQPTAVDAPRTQLIDATNTATYRVFASPLNQDSFCTGPFPAVTELWNAKAGVAGTSGIIEVSTTTLGGSFEHTIRLKNITFENPEGLTFTFGNNYAFGTFVTN